MNIKQKQVINAKTLQRSIKKHKPKVSQKNHTQEEQAQTANDYAVGKAGQYADNTKSAALKTADFAVDGGKKGVRRSMEKRAAKQVQNSVRTAKTAHKAGANVKTAANTTRTGARLKTTFNSARVRSKSATTALKSSTKAVQTSAKAAQVSTKTAQVSAKAAQASAKASAKSTQVVAKTAAKAVSTTARATVKGISLAAKGAMLALKGLIATIAVCGWVAAIVVIIVCLLALILSSAFGIFYANEPSDPNTVPITRAMSDISYDFYAKIDSLKEEYSTDRVEIQGEQVINWKELLTVFSVKSSSEGSLIAQITPDDVTHLQAVFDDTASLTHEVIETAPPSEEETNPDEEETSDESVLSITIEQKPYTKMMSEYGFSEEQAKQAELLLSDQFDSVWAEILGGFVQGSGEIIVSGADVIPTGRFSYPLPDTFNISSYFELRENPFTGELEFHSAIDIAAPQGTPILAADDGVVAVANGTDSWGGSYGYYVKIQHSDGYETLYAHCFSIAVTHGQTVQKGEVIAYVGTTGSSNGNHVHFEVAKNGVEVDPLSFFEQ